MTKTVCLAVDIGASSGRHIAGWWENGAIQTKEIYRFPNDVDTAKDGSLVWNTERLFREIVEGIRVSLQEFGTIASLAVDTWGVDYALLKGDALVSPVYAYRDKRTEAAIPRTHAKIPFPALYQKTGIQFQLFNSLYQLEDDLARGRLAGVTDFLMLPEYFTFLLTGKKAKEYTIATTTGLVNAHTRQFDFDIISKLGLPKSIFKELKEPGFLVGELKEEIAKHVGGQIKVRFAAGHDTASAVEGACLPPDSPYISSGTWSLLGVLQKQAHTDKKSYENNFSNEGGVGGTCRYQKGVMGFWMINRILRQNHPDVSPESFADMGRANQYDEIVDVNLNDFFAPQDMEEAVYAVLRANGSPRPKTLGDLSRCVHRSMAASYRDAIAALEEGAGKRFSTLHIFGGGAKNTFLNELTAAYTGKKVIACPIEATAIGNLKIQLEAADAAEKERQEWNSLT